MKMLTTLVAVIVLVDLADSTEGSERSRLKAAKIIPDIMDDKEYPLLPVKFGSSICYLGNDLTKADTFITPTYDFNFIHHKFYTLLMTEPDLTTQTAPLPGELFHWLVGNIPGNRSSSGEELIGYLPPLSPPGTKAHRYTFLLYQQPKKLNFTDDSLLGVDLINRLFRTARAFAKKYKLGDPIAANFCYKGFDLPVVHGALNVV
ncbi:protein D3-like [Cotesia glomerata]|uniref:protein D3-like n=1 Tax=Cotesia glomerata TaxID=32391 RepID=UPI001D01FF36|nr:protein D3-like [Cotesia glomerata]